MADIKISDMTASTSFSGNAVIPIVETGLNKKVSAITLFANIQDPVVINSASETNDTIIKGSSDANLIHVNATLNAVGIGFAAPLTKLDVNGSFRFTGIEARASSDNQNTSGALNMATDSTIVDSASAIALQIPPGMFEGQMKTIYRKNSGSLTMSAGAGTSIVGASSVTFTVVGSAISLQFLGSVWFIRSIVNCTLT